MEGLKDTEEVKRHIKENKHVIRCSPLAAPSAGPPPCLLLGHRLAQVLPGWSAPSPPAACWVEGPRLDRQVPAQPAAGREPAGRHHCF